MDWLKWVFLGAFFAGILVFAGFGLCGLFQKVSIDPFTGRCFILVSLLLLGAVAWLIYGELRNRKMQNQRKELFSLLGGNKFDIENYRLKYYYCVDRAKKILAEIGGGDANSFNSLVERICEGERKILEKLLEERELLVRKALSERKSDSDFC